MSVFAFIFKYLKKTKVMVGVILFALVVRSIADRGEVYAVSQTIGALPQYASDKSILNNIIFYICLLAFFLFLEGLANYAWRYTSGKFQPYFSSLVYKDIFATVHHQSLTFFKKWPEKLPLKRKTLFPASAKYTANSSSVSSDRYAALLSVCS